MASTARNVPLTAEDVKPDGLPMDLAPRDGRTLRLLVRYSEDEDPGHWTPLEDAFDSWTIGHNSFDHTGEDRWAFVGWDWAQDYYLEAPSGTVIGWLPFHGEAATSACSTCRGFGYALGGTCWNCKGNGREPHTPAPAGASGTVTVAATHLGTDGRLHEAPTPPSNGDVEGAVDPMFLLMKRGLYYRPDAMGYTGIKDNAGRYSKADAEAHVDPESGVSMIAETEAPEFSPKCFDDLAREHLEMKLAQAQAALSAHQEREARAREALGHAAGYLEACADTFDKRQPQDAEARKMRAGLIREWVARTRSAIASFKEMVP